MKGYTLLMTLMGKHHYWPSPLPHLPLMEDHQYLPKGDCSNLFLLSSITYRNNKLSCRLGSCANMPPMGDYFRFLGVLLNHHSYIIMQINPAFPSTVVMFLQADTLTLCWEISVWFSKFIYYLHLPHARSQVEV